MPFTATILNTESNIPIKNGVMHVIRGRRLLYFSSFSFRIITYDVKDFSLARQYHLTPFLDPFKAPGEKEHDHGTLFKFSSDEISSSFTQLLQQTGVIEQLQRSGSPYTLFIPTNAALQSIGVTSDINRIRQVKSFFSRREHLVSGVILS